MFVPEWWRTNAYRVLCLSGDATLSEIHKAAAALRRNSALGITTAPAADVATLGELPRTEADIRTALGRLANPSFRLRDRLFWFQLEGQRAGDGPQASSTDPLSSDSGRSGAAHDEALRGLFSALTASPNPAGAALWVKMLRRWHEVISSDDYWALAMATESRGEFEPAALDGELRAIRDEAMALAAEALLVAGRDAIARKDSTSAGPVLTAIRDLSDTGAWALQAEEDVAAPVLDHFRTLCRALQEQIGSKIVHKDDAAEVNKGICAQALKRYRDEIAPARNAAIGLFPNASESAQRIREESALCLSAIATDFTWADDFITSERLHEEALALARDTLGALRIDHGLSQVREAAHKQRAFGELRPISSAPSLGTLNGVGLTIYGQSDFDPETRSYATTQYFVVLGIPIFPIARYRVISMGGNRYSFLGRLPFRKAERWHLGITLATIAALIGWSMIGSSYDSSSGYATPGSTGTYASSAPQTTSDVPTGLSGTPNAPTTTDQSSHDNTRDSELATLKSRIETGRSQISVLEPQLQPVFDELKNLNARVESIAGKLKALDSQQQAGIQIDIDAYNAQVDEHNALLARHRSLKATYSSELQSYDDLIQRDHALVQQYNTLLGANGR